MKIIICGGIYMTYPNGLFICTNENSENYMEYTGICCEDDCEDGEEF